eukprot:TRINITY_DN23855_c0_g1_i1.p1 TRINITY_DN23855_c0_g1~~TRINITY_DN23855_c0_g1_i1.p1  ORF type:complete len:699 (-),score=231.86 TRINITY_DN23855_c0_g1_i1:70-2166(-)
MVGSPKGGPAARSTPNPLRTIAGGIDDGQGPRVGMKESLRRNGKCADENGSVGLEGTKDEVVQKDEEHEEGDEDEEDEFAEEDDEEGAEGPTFGMKAHYAFDNFMIKPSSAFLIIVVLTLILMLIGGAGLFIVDDTVATSFTEGVWIAWQYINDGAAHTDLTGMSRIVGGAISVAGLVLFAILTGFIFDLITVKMEELRKGKSKVVEQDHTLILGWSDKLFTILKELCDANSTRPDGSHGGVIVILANLIDKEEMLGELDDRIPEEDRMGSKFVVRYGSSMLAYDLAKVAVNAARSIIVLCDTDIPAEKADAATLRVVLSLGGCLTTSKAHIVAEVRDIDCVPLLNLVGQGRVANVVSHDIVGRLMVMSVRQPGLQQVYNEILGFDGDEFYIEEWAEAEGMPFGDLQQHFPDAIPLGIRNPDGIVIIKPNMMRPMEPGDEILFLSEDDDTYQFDEYLELDDPSEYDPLSLEVSSGPGPVHRTPQPEMILMVGWRRDVRDVLELVDDLVAPGTKIYIVAEKPLDSREEELRDSGFQVDKLRNLDIVQVLGHARRHFEKDEMRLHLFTSCIIVADEESEDDVMNSDSMCIQTLLMIRDIQLKRQAKDVSDADVQLQAQQDCPILVETLDARTQDCIATSEALKSVAEFVQSNEMVSLSLIHISEPTRLLSISYAVFCLKKKKKKKRNKRKCTKQKREKKK